MKLMLHVAILSAAALMVQSQAGAQSFPIPTTCTPYTGTLQIPAPESGSVTIENLVKYNFPAQVCVGGTIPSPYNYTVTAALIFNNVTRTNCAGGNWTLNGGPVHVYFTGSGDMNLQTQQFSVEGTGYYQFDNLAITYNGQPYQVSSEIVSGRFQASGTGSSVQATFYVPAGGIPMTVNGQPFNINANLYACLNADQTVLIVQE